MFAALKSPVTLAAVFLAAAACSPSAEQPASTVTISSSSEFQSIPLEPASYTEPSLAVPALGVNDEMRFSRPMTGFDTMLEPAIPTGPKKIVAGIARTVEYCHAAAPRRTWIPSVVYGTTFSQHPLMAR